MTATRHAWGESESRIIADGDPEHNVLTCFVCDAEFDECCNDIEDESLICPGYCANGHSFEADPNYPIADAVRCSVCGIHSVPS